MMKCGNRKSISTLICHSEGADGDRKLSLPAKSLIKHCTWNLQEHTITLYCILRIHPERHLCSVCGLLPNKYILVLEHNHCTGLVFPMWINYSDCNMDISFNGKQFYSVCMHVKYMQASALDWHAEWWRISMLVNTMILWCHPD